MDRMWYYAPGGRDRQGPVSEAQLRDLLAKGQLAPADLVWAEGMADWVAASSIPDLGATASAASGATSATPLVALPSSTTAPGFGSWLTFIGIMNILGGGMSCLTCFGLPIGVLMILAGIACLNAKTALLEVPAVDPAMAPALAKLRTYFVMTGWVYILQIVMMLLMILFYAGIFITMFSTFRQHMP